MNWRWARGLGALGVAFAWLACGGQASSGQGSPGAAGGAVLGGAGAASGAAGTGGLSIAGDTDAGAGKSGATTNSFPAQAPAGCPVYTPGAVCEPLSIVLDVTKKTYSDNGVWAEPLQTPDFGTRPEGYYPPSANTDPASWDRSPMPAGACVFRLHNLPPGCLRPGQITNHDCTPITPSLQNPTVAVDFYQLGQCEQGIAPGCPTADPWNASGLWWYLLPDGTETDVVMCAPQCAASIALYGEACLSLP